MMSWWSEKMVMINRRWDGACQIPRCLSKCNDSQLTENKKTSERWQFKMMTKEKWLPCWHHSEHQTIGWQTDRIVCTHRRYNLIYACYNKLIESGSSGFQVCAGWFLKPFSTELTYFGYNKIIGQNELLLVILWHSQKYLAKYKNKRWHIRAVHWIVSCIYEILFGYNIKSHNESMI